MIASVLILSLGTFASPVIISEVRATREAGHLRVEVEGDGGIDPDQAHAMIDDGRMFLYLGGTRVRADNRSWDLADGTGNVRAHRHRLQTELVIPLARNGCAGPVELAGTPHGLTALVGCEGGAVAAPRATALPRAISAAPRLSAPAAPSVSAGHVPLPSPSRRVSPPAPEVSPASEADAKLKALVALPPERVEPAESPGDEDSAPTPSPSAGAQIPGTGKTPSLGGDKPAPELLPLAVAAVPPPIAPVLVAPVKASPTVASNVSANPTSTPLATLSVSPTLGTSAVPAAEAHTANIAAPAVGLLVLGGAAYLFARRRRAIVPRHIQILETASLGPKRALIVARIGEETLFLGTSEAGITLLKSTRDAPQVADSAPLADSAVHETDIPIAEALADIPQPTGIDFPAAPRAGLRTIEGGLASLFGRRGIAPVAKTLESDSSSSDLSSSDLSSSDLSFDDILEDSVEDQELRRKLAAGLSARAR